MSTLHAFARRLLTQHGLAVGVPPRFEVRDEVGEAIYLEENWRELAAELFDPKGTLAEVVVRAVELGLKPGHIREIVFALHRSYDRLRESDRCLGVAGRGGRGRCPSTCRRSSSACRR